MAGIPRRFFVERVCVRKALRPAFYLLAGVLLLIERFVLISDLRHTLPIPSIVALGVATILAVLVFVLRDTMGNGNGNGH